MIAYDGSVPVVTTADGLIWVCAQRVAVSVSAAFAGSAGASSTLAAAAAAPIVVVVLRNRRRETAIGTLLQRWNSIVPSSVYLVNIYRQGVESTRRSSQKLVPMVHFGRMYLQQITLY